MARSNFAAVMDEVFKHEGGLSMHRGDPGNWTGGRVGVGELRGTNFGIASHAHPDVDIKNLTMAQAREIYRQQYWNPIRGDDLPAGLDLVTMDPAVNSGVSRGVRWLQQALGGDVAVDGRVGPQTLSAAAKAEAVPVIQRACRARMGFLRGLRTWDTFGRGWSRRVASVEAVSVRMAAEAANQRARPVLIDAAQSARTTADREGQAAGGTAVTGVAGGGSVATLADLPVWGLVGFAALVVIVVVILLGQRRHDQDRAEAYQEQAVGARS